MTTQSSQPERPGSRQSSDRVTRTTYPLRFRRLRVARVTPLTPAMVRVTFTGDDLHDFQTLGFDDHLKVIVPPPGSDKPALPEIVDGRPSFPGGARPEMRDYTPRRFDPATRELDIDFVLHGDGPVATWAAQAAPGQTIVTGGPRGSKLVADDFDWYLLVGDETCLPAISRRLEELPAGARAVAVVEVADAAEEQRVETAADVRLLWLHRDGRPAGTTTLLPDAVRALDFPAGEFHAFVGGEAGTVRQVRRHLVEERGLPKEHLNASGYWKLGVRGHDHHEPVD
ncbi:siderophore-interacting protein [Allostreptomyces psammosilenae]|uniref:NADPH-dependent ferric siderophore reductase n=1 Tax=Allostreptomyces psammosilenae TaxID=1892865 RepID=A0A853AB92_9ACTN|nr:siderophore-interacting protein [Allostreptomyces psammosilenae]NYI07881.1 NADPH-dependent ferric siderophore reductase [Allostreptomyces psammosilenae]